MVSAIEDENPAVLVPRYNRTPITIAACACHLTAPKRKFETLAESFTEGSKNVRHLPRYLSIQGDPEFFPAYHH
jgi:hypothetical protein